MSKLKLLLVSNKTIEGKGMDDSKKKLRRDKGKKGVD
jgi:hypothetical protein